MAARGQGGYRLPLALVLGSLAAWLPAATLPPLALAALAALGSLLLAWKHSRLLGCLLLAGCWTHGHVLARLHDRLPGSESRQLFALSGHVASIPHVDPRHTRFEFRVDGEDTDTPRRWMLRWYRDAPPIRAGERWSLTVVAAPPWGRVNFQGEDRERWLLARGIGAVGSVREGRLLTRPSGAGAAVLRWRQSVFDAIGRAVPDARPGGVVQALATADRSRLGREEWDSLRLTGTGHLLAISGLHVGLAAAAATVAARGMLGALPVRLGGRLPAALSLSAGLGAAVAYAALAGFGLPTLRAVLMLSAVAAAAMLGRAIGAFQALLVALAGALLAAPLAPLTAGFWLSFGAVAALLILAVPRPARWSRWQGLIGAQFAVSVFLLPALAFWFGGFSAVALLANLVAIPWVSLVVVPPILLGVAAHAVSAEAVAAAAWRVGGWGAGLLMEGLELAAAIQQSLLGGLLPLHAPGLAPSFLAAAGAALLLMPRGLPLRWGGLFFLLPLFTQPGPGPRGGQGLGIEFLDVGQGTAVVLRQDRRTLLYDTGPGDGGEVGLVNPVIAPALHAMGGADPDLVVVSHGDLDHAGGLGDLLNRYPAARFVGSLRHPPPGVSPCRAGEGADWGDWRAEILHPNAALPYLGNDSSCVVSLSGPDGAVLLAGDVSATIEARLLAGGMGPHEVVLVPHHGSLTSSSDAFVRTVAARVAIATAGPGNRFGFPRDEVRARYERAGALFWSTADCGAIRLHWAEDGTLRATSARRERPAQWRWPAHPACPLDRTVP